MKSDMICKVIFEVSQNEKILEAFLSGVSGYLVKPLKRQTIIDHLVKLQLVDPPAGDSS